jgi:hypothetical protein
VFGQGIRLLTDTRFKNNEFRHLCLPAKALVMLGLLLSQPGSQRW